MRSDQVILSSAAAFAAINFGEVLKKLKETRDRIYFGSGDYLPLIGTLQMSYARLIQLLLQKKVKRVYLLADGQIAIVEVPFETHASDYSGDIRYDKNDLSVVYIDQKPEWKMEKMRYYCELPGDIWEDGSFLRLMKRNQYHRTKRGRMKYEWMLKEHQVTAELVVMDPNDAYVFLNEFVGQFIPIIGLFLLRIIVWIGTKLTEKYGKKRKDPMQELAEQYARPRMIEFNVGDDENRNDTGVRFADVAGVDNIVSDILEVLKMMRGDERYRNIGAKPPKGIMLEGPPGTGKTYLARAMAGEGSMPFYSCNGAEFVEMFSGIAAARIRNLFKIARKKAPSIIFIDEIDAIGKKRGEGGDSGSSEREAGLMQLLVEMDGTYGDDGVLVIGATNRLGLLDPALMRPGRFDRVIFMGLPSEMNRMKILEVHARGKPIAESPQETHEVLEETAELTLGYSGADLANLLNEAAILSVRAANLDDKSTIDEISTIGMLHIREAIQKVKLGLPQKGLPESTAKKFLTTILAGRAVALACTPGIPEIDMVTTRPQGEVLGRIIFQTREYGSQGDTWHQLTYPGYETNAVKLDHRLSMFELCAALMVPLFAGRVTEEVLFGPQSVTLSTTDEISVANELAHYFVARSNLHPAFRHVLLRFSTLHGGMFDPTIRDTSYWFERYTSHFIEVSYQKTSRFIDQYSDVIKEVAERILSNEDEILKGSEIVEIIRSTSLRDSQIPEPSFNFDTLYESLESIDESTVDYVDHQGALGTTSFQSGIGQVAFSRPIFKSDKEFAISKEATELAVELIIGRASMFELLTPDIAGPQIEKVRKILHDKLCRNRLKAIKKFWSDKDAPMPPPPVYDTELKVPGIYDTLRQVASDPIEMQQDLDFWRNRTPVKD
eukprot:g8941.t1